MRLKEVNVSYARTINLGDFNSAKIECSMSAEIDEGDDLDACMKACWEMAKSNVKAQALPLKGKQQLAVKEIFLGLPMEVQSQLNHEADAEFKPVKSESLSKDRQDLQREIEKVHYSDKGFIE